MRRITYNVRVYKTRTYHGVNVTTYYVRWMVDGREWTEPFRNVAQADSFRSELVSAARKGESFSVETGRPASWERDEPEPEAPGPSWYEFARSYAAAKWPYVAPNHRRGIAEALIDATEVLMRLDSGKPESDLLRRALREWTFSALASDAKQPPSDIEPAVRWLEQHTVRLADLAGDEGATLSRRILDRISRKKDGLLAAANTANRKRMVINNAMEYACEIRALPFNPLKQVKWAKPRTLRTVDPVLLSTAARRGVSSPPLGHRGGAVAAWSHSSAACITRHCGPRKP